MDYPAHKNEGANCTKAMRFYRQLFSASLSKVHWTSFLFSASLSKVHWTFFISVGYMSHLSQQNISFIMKKIVFLISMLFVEYATFAQTIVIDDEYAKDGPVLRLNNNKYSNTVCLYDSSMGIDSLCGQVACVCSIDKRGKVKGLDVLWFFQSHPTNKTYMKREMGSHLYKTIVDNLGFEIRKNGIIVCPSNVKIMGTRQNFTIPIVIRSNRVSAPTPTKKARNAIVKRQHTQGN